MYPFFLLLRSESPSQVFIIVLSWLCVVLKNINPANWSNIFLAYDNMCHLVGLRAAKNLLPWCSPWDKAWMSVKKIIDRLHISNHKDKKCKEKYDPSTLKEEIPNGNTMAAEQTFVWLSHFKKILCAMPKVHHLFFLHRMVKHRNNYTVRCYKNGRKPLLPKARGKLCWHVHLQSKNCTIRESSFNMTRGGWRYWNLKLEILAAPSLAVQFFTSPPLLLVLKYTNFRSPP